MNEADQADKTIEALLEARVRTASHAASSINIYANESGVCWECKAPVPDKRRWCSPECRQAAEKDF
jgi:RNA polymerase-binding transcription factor DksA